MKKIFFSMRKEYFFQNIEKSYAETAFVERCLSSHISTSVEQKNILEYVPINIPKIIASTKSLVVTPPKKYKAANVIKVVNEVLILLANV